MGRLACLTLLTAALLSCSFLDAGDKSSKVIATFKGHKDTVAAVAFSPDGKHLVTGSFDGTVKLWETSTAKQIRGFEGPKGHTKQVLAVAYRPDGRQVASAGADNFVKVWDADLPSAGPVRDVPIYNLQHPNIVDAVAFSPNAPVLATGGHDGKVRLFDLVKGTQIKEINAHLTKDATMVYAVAFSPDGKQLVSTGFDNSLKLWNVPGGELVREFKAHKVKEFEKGHQESVLCVAFSPDGKFLASGTGGVERVIKLWNVADGSVMRDFDNPRIKHPPSFPQSHPGWVNGVGFSKDGKRLISAGDAPGNNGYVAVWSVGDGKLLAAEELPLGMFHGLALDPEGQKIAVGAGTRGRATADFNHAYLLNLPK